MTPFRAELYPVNYKMDKDLLRLLSQANAKYTEYKIKLQTLDFDSKYFLDSILLSESLKSTQIEGIQISQDEMYYLKYMDETDDNKEIQNLKKTVEYAYKKIDDGKDIDFGIFSFPNQAGDAKLIKETNMTFMKSAKTEQEDTVDQIFNRLLRDQKLAQEIADFTQTSSLIEGVTDNNQNKIQSDIQSYEAKNEVIDVTTGNEQLTWTFQKKVAEQQLLWLNKKILLEDVLKYADDHREQSCE